MKNHSRGAVAALSLVALFSVSVAPAWALEYTITDLGTFGGWRGDAVAINNNGQVVGSAYTSDYADHYAVLYSNGTMTDLGSLGGTFTYVDPYGINDHGQVVGQANTADDTAWHAFLYSNGAMTDLGTMGGVGVSGATGINNYGQVVGYSMTDDFRTFLYSNGTMTDIGTLGGPGITATGINDSGQVVGVADTAALYPAGGAIPQAFLYSNGMMTDLGALGGIGSRAHGINNMGQVVGEASTADFDASGYAITHAFLYSNGKMIDIGPTADTRVYIYFPGGKIDIGPLGATYSVASGINNYGQVVGAAWGGASNGTYVFLYSDGVLLDLNGLLPVGSGWTLTDAIDINDLGQIVGRGITSDGDTHAFLMTPVPVPVPASLWLLGSGLLGLMGMTRRKTA
jgi:probable HAF family extracellular repeat protein